MPVHTVESISLYFIQTLGKSIEKLKDIEPFIDETLPPSEILGMTSRFLGVLNDVDGCISSLNVLIPQMEICYRDSLTRYRALQNTLISRYNEREDTEIQMNTLSEFYDGENLIKDIVMSNDTFVITTSDVSSPDQYSVLNLYKRMEKDSGIFDSIEKVNYEMFRGINSKMRSLLSAVISMKKLIKSYKFTQAMTSNITTPECAKYISIIYGSLRATMQLLGSMKDSIVMQFQTYIALERNYAIYKRAIDTATTITLESVFNSHDVYVLI